MGGRFVAVGAIGMACAFLFAAPLGAAPAAKKQIRIESRTLGITGGSGNFFLALGKGGDIGKVTFTRSSRPEGEQEATAPDGQQYFIETETDTLKGKKGTLVIRAVGPSYSLGIGNHEAWEGTWKIVSGTGDYSGWRGGGRYFGVGTQIEPPEVIKRSTGFVQP
jgi:hypothetical protein